MEHREGSSCPDNMNGTFPDKDLGVLLYLEQLKVSYFETQKAYHKRLEDIVKVSVAKEDQLDSVIVELNAAKEQKSVLYALIIWLHERVRILQREHRAQELRFEEVFEKLREHVQEHASGSSRANDNDPVG